jgi:hypothetical protein
MPDPKPRLIVAWCSYQAAKYAVEHWHYSRTMQKTKTAAIGAWEDGRFIGAVCFTAGSGNFWRGYGLTPFEVCELARVALTTHRTPVSRILRIAIGMIRRQYPKLRLIISYADPREGHVGGIYQATNWIYTGRSNNNAVYEDRTGKLWHSRTISKRGYVSHFGKVHPCPDITRMTRVIVPGKYRYLMPLDEAMRAQIEPLRKPYPKKEKSAASIDSDAPGLQPGEGGANPTAALQIDA